MNLLLIGHSVADIVEKSGEINIQPGGMYYTASALKELSSEEDKLFMCTQIDKKYFPLFKNVYDRFDLSLTENVSEIPMVELNTEGHFERKEHYKNISNKLNINYSKLRGFDGILINMITGFDIDAVQLNKIRQSTKALIYFDVHTLSRGLDEKMHREFRRIPDFEKWAQNIDIIQCNEHEIYTLSEKKIEKEIVEELFHSGIKIVCLTKGERGVRIYYQNKNEIASFYRASKKIGFNNKIGCGDVFGAVFFYSYILNENIFEAAEFASSSAEFIASVNDLNELKNLKQNAFK